MLTFFLPNLFFPFASDIRLNDNALLHFLQQLSPNPRNGPLILENLGLARVFLKLYFSGNLVFWEKISCCLIFLMQSRLKSLIGLTCIINLSVCLSLSLSVSLILTISLSLYVTLSISFCQSVAVSHTHTHSPSLSLSLSVSLPHTPMLPIPHTPFHTRTRTRLQHAKTKITTKSTIGSTN